jgi:serine/threonine protein kinase
MPKEKLAVLVGNEVRLLGQRATSAASHNAVDSASLVDRPTADGSLLAAASRLSMNINEFYTQWARLSNMRSASLDKSAIREVILHALKDNSNHNSKIMDIMEEVDKLYAKSGWVFIGEQTTGINAEDSGYYDRRATTPISTPKATHSTRRSTDNCSPFCSTPPNKHLMTPREADATLKPHPKRRRTATDPRWSSRTPSAHPESESSSSASTSGSTDRKCRETNCTSSTKPGNMMRHYTEKHCPTKAYMCPVQIGKAPCTYWNTRRDNFLTHLKSTKHGRELTEEEIREAETMLDDDDDDYIIRIRDFGHHICPLCGFPTSKSCLEHIMTHYKDGTSATLEFNDRREQKYDAQAVQKYIESEVQQKLRKKQPKPKSKTPFDGQDDNEDDDEDGDDDEDSGQGGPPRRGDPDVHGGYSGNPGDHSHDYHSGDGGSQRGGGGASQRGARGHDARSRPSAGNQLRANQCHVKFESSTLRLPFISPCKSKPSCLTHAQISNLSVSDAMNHGNRGSCLTYIGELGRGGFGIVDEVRCNSTNETFARKVVSIPHSPSLATSSEVRILRRLHHFHVIKLVDTWETHLGLSILMSPVAKSDLAHYLRRAGAEPHTSSPFNEPEKQPLRKWIGCLSSALAYLHGNGVIHGDIKPKNILISSDQVLYIADFGTAKFVEESPMTAQHILPALTPMYCAPEIAYGQATILDYPADVFSLGCVWAEMATVYAGQSVRDFEKFRRSDSREAAFHATIPRALMWIDALSIPREVYDGSAHDFLRTVRDMLHFDPRKRPTMKDLADRFLCSCWASSGSGASTEIYNRCYGPAKFAVLGSALDYQAVVSAPCPINDHTACNNKSMGPARYEKPRRLEDDPLLSYFRFRENGSSTTKRPTLSLLWITSEAVSGDRHLKVLIIYYLDMIVLTYSRMGPRRQRRLSSSR